MSPHERGGMRLIVFSAIGSLPLHIAAVLVFVPTPVDLPDKASGLISSAILCGLFAAVLAQAFGLARRLTATRLLPLVAAQVATLVALPFLPMILGFAAWFLVGAISGVFMFKGMVAAAGARDKYLGFLARLAVAMALAGLIAMGVSAIAAPQGYLAACLIYAFIVLAVYVAMRPDEKEAAAITPPQPPGRLGQGSLVVLLPLVLFYVGALMVGSHLPLFIKLHGPVDADPMQVFGFAKIGGALVLIATLLTWRRDSLMRLLLSAGLMVVAIVLLGVSTVLPILGVAIVFELALNIAGAAFMGEVARTGPSEAHRFIPAAGLAGIAAGPSVGAYVAAELSPAALLAVAVGVVVMSLALHVNRRQWVLPVLLLAVTTALSFGSR